MKSEQDDFTMEINYDKQSKKEGTIKIITKKSGDEIYLDSDMLLDTISKFIKKDLGIVLSEVDRKEIWMMMIKRLVQFPAPKDYKQGEMIITEIPMAYPAALYALETEFGLCKQGDDKQFYAITHEDVLPALAALRDGNKDFVEHWVRLQTGGRKDLEELKKIEIDRQARLKAKEEGEQT